MQELQNKELEKITYSRNDIMGALSNLEEKYRDRLTDTLNMRDLELILKNDESLKNQVEYYEQYSLACAEIGKGLELLANDLVSPKFKNPENAYEHFKNTFKSMDEDTRQSIFENAAIDNEINIDIMNTLVSVYRKYSNLVPKKDKGMLCLVDLFMDWVVSSFNKQREKING